MSLTAIQSELHAITAQLQEAAEKINAGVTLDLSDIKPRAQKLCEEVLQLSPLDAAVMLPELEKVVTQLDALSTQLKS